MQGGFPSSTHKLVAGEVCGIGFLPPSWKQVPLIVGLGYECGQRFGRGFPSLSSSLITRSSCVLWRNHFSVLWLYTCQAEVDVSTGTEQLLLAEVESRHPFLYSVRKKMQIKWCLRLRVGTVGRHWSITGQRARHIGSQGPSFRPCNDGTFLSSCQLRVQPWQPCPLIRACTYKTPHILPASKVIPHNIWKSPEVNTPIVWQWQEYRILYYFFIPCISGFWISFQFSKRVSFCFFSTLISGEVLQGPSSCVVENNMHAPLESVLG